MKLFFNLNYQGGEKFPSQEIYDLQILGNKTMIIARYEDVTIYIFQSLAVKLWLKENDDLHTNSP